MKYQVNVRAIVRGPVCESDDERIGQVWDVYDYQSPDDDGVAVVRCDTHVEVEADGPEKAAEAAKNLAPAIDVRGIVVDDCTFWVDEAIDIVSLADTAHSPLEPASVVLTIT